jgi:hypothetical protein
MSILVPGGAGFTGRNSAVQVTESRQPEVGCFIANIGTAQHLYDVRCPEDPA